MQPAYRRQTTILPGHRLEIYAPELAEGDTVDVIILSAKAPVSRRRSILTYLGSLPAGPRSHASWEEMEQRFQEEREAWDR